MRTKPMRYGFRTYSALVDTRLCRPRFSRIPITQPNASANVIIARGDSVAILEMKKAAPKGGFSNKAE
jgi:hypothetical protein